MPAPRIAPSTAPEAAEIAAAAGAVGKASEKLFDGKAEALRADKPLANVLATIGNNPGLLATLTPALAQVAGGALPARDRELVILRVAWSAQSAYEWAHHARIAAAIGLDESEVARVAEGPDAGWSEFEAALLRAVDELHGAPAAISDPTWQVLSSRYDQNQLLELLALAGLYTTLAYILNSCRTPIDSWLENPAPLPGPR